MFKKRSASSFNPEHVAAIQILSTKGIGSITARRLFDLYGSPTKAIEHFEEHAQRARRKITLLPEKAALKIIKDVYQYGGETVLYSDEDYPDSLNILADSPPLLYVKGQRGLLKQHCVAVVGSRNASLSGRKLTYKLAIELAESNYVVVSGMARGIDTSAHEGALQKGSTIAVLAGGIDNIYPPENAGLYHKICTNGLIVSENPLGMQPIARHFPRRNRIVVGLSLGTVVVEAAKRSGSLITADLAVDYGRDVFAVPGQPGDPRASGTNHLIKSQKAQLIDSANDVIKAIKNMTLSPPPQLPTKVKDEFDLFVEVEDVEVTQNIVPETAAQESRNLKDVILKSLSKTPISVDMLVRDLQRPTNEILSALMELELSQDIQKHPGNKVSLI